MPPSGSEASSSSSPHVFELPHYSPISSYDEEEEEEEDEGEVAEIDGDFAEQEVKTDPSEQDESLDYLEIKDDDYDDDD